MKEDNSQFTIKPIYFYKSPLYSSPFITLNPPQHFLLSQQGETGSECWVGGKLRTWPGAEVELNWTQKELLHDTNHSPL